MFIFPNSVVDYRDPWHTSYDSRLAALSSKSKRIAYFYELPDTSTFRYRAFNPGLTLAADPTGDTSASWFDLRDLERDSSFVDEADALVLCRVRYSAQVAKLIARARARHIPVLFDCDDLVFDTERLHLLVDSLGTDQDKDSSWDSWFAYIGRLGATLRLCDGMITTNEFLAERAREFVPNLPTTVMPNYLNPQQQELSAKLYKAKTESFWFRNDKIHIGYFSGSPTHARDFAVAKSAIYRLMETDSRIVLRVVGFGAFNNEFDKFGDRVEKFPLQDFLNLQRLIAEVEINIAPLQENQFTNSKSELKFFEAAICGTLTLATPTYTFKNSMKHGQTGLLVPSYEWDSALRRAVQIVEDKRMYSKFAKDSFEFVEKNYGWNRLGSKVRASVFG